MTNTPTNTPPWLTELANNVAALLESYDVLAPLGCHFYEVEGIWEVALFCGSTEVVGGEFDGRRQDSRFFLDILALTALFDHVETLHWQSGSLDPQDELGSHIALTGIAHGTPVSFRVLAHAPEQFPPARKALAYDRTLEDLW